MDSGHFPNFASHTSSNSDLRLFSGDSSLQPPAEVIDLTLPAPSFKRKLNQVDPYDVIEIDGDDQSDAVMSGLGDVLSGKKRATLGHGKNGLTQIKDSMVMGSMDSDTNSSLTASASWNPQNTSWMWPQNFTYSNELYPNYADFDGGLGFVPPFYDTSPTPWMNSSIPLFQNLEASQSINFITPREPNSCQQSKSDGDEIVKKFGLFKQFDTVRDSSDHYFNKPQPNSFHGRFPTFSQASLTKKEPMEWSKKIQQEWKILRKDLPDSIFVRVYEERMDLLRAVIVGAAGTPYHDGLFFFDIFFPPDYPSQPPMVHYYSGGLRLNPNLYNSGKVCLSLLNTWSGSKNEIWTPGKSTMLQVLLSIQALVLNAKPYFNEPGFTRMAGTPLGEKNSLDYNENVFLLSCQTMLYTIQKPLKHFEDFIAGHFYKRANSILEACKAYMDGAQVGCLVGGGVQDVDEGDKSCSANFKAQLGQVFPRLLTAFSDHGANCKQVLHHQSHNSDQPSTWLKL